VMIVSNISWEMLEGIFEKMLEIVGTFRILS